MGVAGRFFFHEVSGLIFYTSYAESMRENAVAIWASTAYNLSYLLPEAVLTLLLLAIPPVRNMFAQIKKMAVGN